tara:strand:+ start:15952 stop:16260 length:309 start_codon:yes stop_codon:yes gene_type:complete
MMAVPNSIEEFNATLSQQTAPSSWPEALRAMWFDAKGDWESSHEIAQDLHTSDGSWIHAYLHRKEGDKFNAGYWYRMAGKKIPEIELDVEQRQLVAFFLAQQ